MTTGEEYIVLKPESGRDEFARQATALKLAHHETREGDGEKRAYEEVWATPDQRSAVHYVEDPVSGTRFLWVRGANVQKFSYEFTKRLDTYVPEEVVEDALKTTPHDEQVRAIFRLAVTFPTYDEDAFRVFEAYATKAPDPLLRRATLNAMAYRCWPEFIPVFEKVEKRDRDPDVRATAARLLPHCRAARK